MPPLTRHHLPAFLLAVLVFLVTFASPMSYEGMDAHLSLLVSQSLLENGTTRLDEYHASGAVDIGLWSVQAPNGHYYYYWPVGPSALSVPYVWMLNRLGVDMAVVASNHRAQNLLSAFLCAAVFLVIYQIGRCYLDSRASLAIAGVSVLGSSLVSTMGTALWNIDFTVLFVVLSLLLVCRFDTGRGKPIDPFILGVFLFGAFFCRPTAAIFIVVVLAYLLVKSRRMFLKTASVASVFLALFVFWSWMEYGTVFPSYYSTGRFGTYPLSAWLALYAHFLSPSRGILTFSPFFALVLLSAAWLLRTLAKNALFAISIAWLALHLVVASNAERWWGGHSFGPRLDTEVLPALILLTILVWRVLSERAGVRARRLLAAGYLSLGLVAVWINVGQGLYNQNTLVWSGGIFAPEIDTYPEYLLDWRYPQFLATNRSLCQRNLEHLSQYDVARLAPYMLDDEITYASGLDEIPPGHRMPSPAAASTTSAVDDLESSRVDTPVTSLDPPADPALGGDNLVFLPTALYRMTDGPNALFIGWSAKEEGYRWSICESARIVLKLGAVDTARSFEVELLAGSFGPQQVDVLLNGSPIGTLFLDGAQASHVLKFDGTHLFQSGINVVEFKMPDAVTPGNFDVRLLGIQLVTFRIRPLPDVPQAFPQGDPGHLDPNGETT